MNTTVIIIMIVCATAIAIVAIICDHLFEKQTTLDDCSLSKKIIKVHRNYIAGFLGFAVIMLITSKYGGTDGALFTYLSFASTITSFVLSILAIFITVQSNSDLYKQFTRIDNATDTIKQCSTQIEGTVQTLNAAETKIGTMVENISQTVSQTVSQKVDKIVEMFDERLQARIKETENKILGSMNKVSGEQQQTGSDQSYFNRIKDYFITLTSGNGLLALYACALSFEHGNKQFDLSNLFRGNETYVWGFLIASISCDIVRFTNEQKDVFVCNYSRFSSSDLYKEIKRRETLSNNDADYLNDVMKKIRVYFGVEQDETTT